MMQFNKPYKKQRLSLALFTRHYHFRHRMLLPVTLRSPSGRSTDMVETQSLNGSRDHDHTHPGVICIVLAMVNLCTKFEISISAHYKRRKGDTKYRKWNGMK